MKHLLRQAEQFPNSGNMTLISLPSNLIAMLSTSTTIGYIIFIINHFLTILWI
jgi:hypothetical protein